MTIPSTSSPAGYQEDVVERDYRRGQLMLAFLRTRLDNLADKKVLDVGAGKGGITLAFAEECRVAVGLDLDWHNCALVCEARRLNNPRARLHILRAAAERLPFKSGYFDIVIVNGVMEWVGSSAQNPTTVQRQMLAEVARVLSSGGILYLAIENRLFPAFLLIDPHTHQALVNLLPRRMSRALTKLLRGREFGNYIYSWWGLRDLIAEPLPRSEFYVPIPHYHYPHRYADLDDSRAIRRLTSELSRDPNLPTKLRLTLLYDSIISSVHANRIALPYFVVVAKKV